MDKRIKTLQDKNSYLNLQKEKRITLLEVLDRALDKGVVVSGDIVISVADVDLIYLGLKVLLSSVETMEHLRGTPMPGATEEPT
ncbi:MAG: gas vesicle protein [Nitrospirota bacterium]